MRVLLISSSEAEALYLHKALREGMYSPRVTDDLRHGACLAADEPFDAVLIVAPGAGTVAGHLPALTHLPNSPAIVLVLEHATATERTDLLRAGADACFTQPYSFNEMHERLFRMHRYKRVVVDQKTVSHLAPLTHELIEHGKRMVVTKREYLLLECLLRQPNIPVANDHIMQYAWPAKDEVELSSVNCVVTRLRKKMARHGFTTAIETERRFGYQLTTPS